MEYQNSSNSSAREVTGTEDIAAHRASMQIDFMYGDVLTVIRLDDAPSAQQQGLILSITNSLKTSL